MKKAFFTILFFFSILTVLSAQDAASQKKNPVGNWKFEAPYAPQGYNNGSIIVVSAENKLSATMSFDSMQYQFPAEKVKAVADSLYFSINLEGQSVDVSLKLTDDSNMTGKAVYSEGSVPLTVKRIAEAVKQ